MSESHRNLDGRIVKDAAGRRLSKAATLSTACACSKSSVPRACMNPAYLGYAGLCGLSRQDR